MNRSSRSRRRRRVWLRSLRRVLAETPDERLGYLDTGADDIVFPDAPKVKIDLTADPVEIPSVGSSIQQLQATLGSIAKKLDKLPLEAVGSDLRELASACAQLVADTTGRVEAGEHA